MQSTASLGLHRQELPIWSDYDLNWSCDQSPLFGWAFLIFQAACINKPVISRQKRNKVFSYVSDVFLKRRAPQTPQTNVSFAPLKHHFLPLIKQFQACFMGLPNMKWQGELITTLNLHMITSMADGNQARTCMEISRAAHGDKNMWQARKAQPNELPPDDSN